MPNIQVNGTRLFFAEGGEGPETIVFSHGLLFDRRIFDRQVAHFRDRFRCIAYDHRGQGESAAPPSGYDMNTLAADAAALIERLDATPCHFVGLSMGGFVGLRLAINRPELLRSLVLIGTSADPEPWAHLPRYHLMRMVARWLGLRLVVDRIMGLMFSAAFLQDEDRRTLRETWRDRLLQNDPRTIVRPVDGVIRRAGVADCLGAIRTPTLIIVGEHDTTTPPVRAERLHDGIKGSVLVRVARAGHITTVEQPEAVNRAMETFLQKADGQNSPQE